MLWHQNVISKSITIPILNTGKYYRYYSEKKTYGFFKICVYEFSKIIINNFDVTKGIVNISTLILGIKV